MEVVILHVSDVHCATENLKRLLREESYDVVAATGDFECTATAKALLDAQAPVVAVTGNMDHAGIARLLREAGVLIDGEVASRAGLTFAGIGGMDVRTSLEKLLGKRPERVDVLLSHHPPKGVVDRVFMGLHAGLREVLEAARTLRPRVHLCGHIHESRGTGRVNGTLVVNPGPLKSGYYALVHVAREGVRADLNRLK